MSQQADQAQYRRYQFVPDQHGRKYGVPIEKSTGHPCGPWEPQFVAPLMPNPDFMRIAEDPEYHTLRVFIDYDEWIKVVQDADKEWRFRERKAMTARHRENYSTSMPTDPDIIDMIGQRPSITSFIVPGTVQPLVAAKQGNKWMLGTSPVEDPRLAKYFVKPVNEEATDYSEDWQDLEEQYDADASGGKTVPTPSSLRKQGGTPPKKEAA